MIIKCPSCNTQYDCEPGKYECECGAKFSLASDGNLSIEEPVMSSGQTADLDIDKTIPPRKELIEVESSVTIPGKRDRKPGGRFEVGDLILDRYKVLAELGQGGMGIVYKCFDETAGVVIALKAIPQELSCNTIEMEDVKDNFQLVSKLVHQNIAISKTLEKDNATGNYYLIMECVEGEDLRRWIKRRRKENSLTIEVILPVIRQVADALDYAHKEKVIHRDVKPGNIMIDQAGHVKVLDFGLAAQIHTSMTRVSMAYHGTSGTAPYMAPEQWRGKTQGAAADQYALAVMTYEVFSGHLPFDGVDVSVLREAVLNENADPIQGVPEYVQQALARGMSKNPANRFLSCGDFVVALAGEQTAEKKTKCVAANRLANIDSSKERNADNEIALKRVHVLMEQGEWDKSREYCERLLDSDPENPELYLLLCLIKHEVSNESLLLKCKNNLSEDKYFSTAIKFAPAERKQQLIDIQSEQQQSMLQEYEFYINKCLEMNKVSDVSMLSKCKSSLAESIYFRMAFDCASPEQKKVLLHIQEEQNKNESFIRKIWRNSRQIRKGGILGIIIGLLLSPILGVSLYLSADERIHWPEEIPELLLVGIVYFIPVGLFLGISMELLWEKCYTPKNKKMVLLWGTIIGTILCQIALILSVLIVEVRRGNISSFSDKITIAGALIFGIPFGLIWSLKWFRKTNNRKDEAFRKIQEAQTEYALWEHKRNNTLSKDEETTLEEIEKKQKDEELLIAEKKQLKKVGISILATFILFGTAVFVIMGLRREDEFKKGLAAYEAKDYVSAAIHFKNAQEFGYTLDTEKQTFLGTCYFFGTGIENDYSKAIDLFWRNAQNGYSVAQYYLGICFYHGLGCVPDTEQAIRWLYRAAEQDVPVAKLELGKIFYELKDGDNLAEQRDHLLPYKLGRNGRFTTMSQSECVEEFLSEAVLWFQKVPELAEAQFYLGKCYENGDGVEKDITQAMEWYRKAAEQGFAEAKDKIKILETYLKAKDGDAEAQYELGNSYYAGTGGVMQDYSEAMKWYRKAERQGHAGAKNFMEQCKIVDLSSGVSLAMVKVDIFSTEIVTDEEKDNLRRLTPLNKDFYIGQTEITQAQWKAVMNNNPSTFRGDDYPVECVSWNDAKAFCSKLNKMGKAPNGWEFTLPTEAQWEYAARGGKKSQGYQYSGSDLIDEVAWFPENSQKKTHPVGSKKKNELELYDMSGNVWEWCLDEYKNDTREDYLRGKMLGIRRVVRGGCFNQECPISFKAGMVGDTETDTTGFRLVLIPNQ